MDIHKHPCFNGTARDTYGRVHLPVAPRCNIQCKYCNRRFDCVSESRPGVSSTVLSPGQAIAYLGDLLKIKPQISVVGIAGPGDPFSNAEATMSTLRMVRQKYPEMLLCTATNGLEVAPFIDELVDLQLSHITLTINAVDPEITAKMVSWVRYGKKVYRGIAAGELLLEKQQRALERLVATEMIVKVNTVIVPGYNDRHLNSLGNYLLDVGVDLQNCIAFHPVKDTPFEEVTPPDPNQMHAIRTTAGGYVEQMEHCRRCRADAAGMLTDRCGESPDVISIADYAKLNVDPSQHRPYVAVVSQEGLLVNRHLGEAVQFDIYELNEAGRASQLASRSAPPPGGGNDRWVEVARILSDCRALLVNDIGPRPLRILNDSGLVVHRVEGMIEELAPRALRGEDLMSYQKVEKFSCGTSCSGKGTGCM